MRAHLHRDRVPVGGPTMERTYTDWRVNLAHSVGAATR
jgi:hypothetical protein